MDEGKDPKPPKVPDMRVTVAGIELASPIIAASGTFAYGVEFEELVAFSSIGAFVTKGLSAKPMAGNPTPRIIESASGMMNAIGLQNMGVEAFDSRRGGYRQRFWLHHRGLPGGRSKAERHAWYCDVRTQRFMSEYHARRHGLRHRPQVAR